MLWWGASSNSIGSRHVIEGTMNGANYLSILEVFFSATVEV